VLPTTRRLAGLWMRPGLLLGPQLAVVICDDHVLLILMAAFVGVTSGAEAGALRAWIADAIDLFLGAASEPSGEATLVLQDASLCRALREGAGKSAVVHIA
jgi:hypothetical protein